MKGLRLQDYLVEVSKIELLEKTAEKTLWLQYKSKGDLDSRRQLIEHYQPLVVKVLSHWRGGNETVLMDLVQEGIIGLIEAVEKFEPERGVAFSLYAIHRIRGRMLNFLEKEAKGKPISLDIESETLPDEKLSVAETAERNFLVDQLHLAMERLPNKERLALNGIYFEEQEPRQIATMLQISPSHFYRLQQQGIRRVRGMLSRLMAEMKK